jgi:hypothetical protein
MSKENPMICDNHIDIRLYCGKISSIISKIKDKPIELDVWILLTEIEHKLKEIDFMALDAMTQGQKMEKRMRKYFNAITRLGFTRNGRND